MSRVRMHALSMMGCRPYQRDSNDRRTRGLFFFQVQQALLGIDVHAEVSEEIESEKS